MADGSIVRPTDPLPQRGFFTKHTPPFTFNTIYENGSLAVVAALDTTLGADELPYYTFF